MVNHCEACDSYKTCDKRPSALLPAVYVKQVHSIFLTAGLKPESEMRSLELPRPCWCYLPTSDPSKVFQEKKKNQTKKRFQISLHLRLNQSRELQFPPTVRTIIKKKKTTKKQFGKCFKKIILHQNSLTLKLACAQGWEDQLPLGQAHLKVTSGIVLLKTATVLSRQSKQQVADVVTFRSVISNHIPGYPRSYGAQSSVHSVKNKLKSTLTCQMRFKFHQPKKKN